MRTLPLAALLAFFLTGSSARAGFGSLRATFEPCVNHLQTADRPRSYGIGAGGSAELGLSDQLGLTIFANWQRFPGRAVGLEARALGATLLYRLDVWRISPYIEAGVAGVTFSPEQGVPPPAEMVLTLGLGFEVIHFDWLLWGVVMRYYPVFETDLLSAPAFATLHARIGVALDWGK